MMWEKAPGTAAMLARMKPAVSATLMAVHCPYRTPTIWLVYVFVSKLILTLPLCRSLQSMCPLERNISLRSHALSMHQLCSN